MTAGEHQNIEDVVRTRLLSVANAEWGLGLDDDQIASFIRYAQLLVEWNAKFNLTRLISPEQIATGHFLDSLAVLKAVDIPAGSVLIDVGSGAGLPGVVLKIARPDLTVTLLDSTAKKLVFCDTVIGELGLVGVSTVHARAEEHARHVGAVYGIAVARAVAPLENLLPWCAPLVKVGGQVIALKGVGVQEEMDAGRAAASKHQLSLGEPVTVCIPNLDGPMTRYVVVADRTRPGPRELHANAHRLKRK